MTGNTPQELQMTRLSQSLEAQLGVRLQHSDLKKLGYKAEKRPNNPNTYYKVPGLNANIENCPKVVKYIKQVFLQNKKQELEKLLGKGVTPKLPPSSNRRGAAAAAAADAAPEDQGADDDENEDEEESSEEEESEMEEVKEEPAAAAAAAVDASGNPPPAGFVFVTGEKQVKVLEGMASYISANTHLRSCTGPDLLAKGVVVVEESKPLAPGERMRHAFVWWHGKLDEPLRCAQYIFAAKNLLEQEKAREALGLPPLPPSKASGGSASVPAKKRPSTASEGLLTPPAPSGAAAAAKRKRTSTGEAASKTPVAPLSAPPASNAAGRSSKASQAAAAAAAAGGGGAASGGAGARASHFPVSPSQSGGTAAAAGGAATGTGGGKTRGSIKAAAAAAAGSSGAAAAGGKAAAAAVAAAVKLGAGNQQVLDSVDDAVKLLAEALQLARSLPPSVLNSLPSVFTAGLDGTLQEFLSAAVAMHEGLKADKELLISMASDYAAELTAGGSSSGFSGSSSSRKSGAAAAAAESHYRRPYLAFRAALGSCASDAHAWLQDKQQREMIARLEGLCQIKQQLEDKKSQEAQMRQEQEAMRQQKERLEQELKAYKERLKQMEDEQNRRKSGAAVGEAARGGQQQAGVADTAGAAKTDQAA